MYDNSKIVLKQFKNTSSITISQTYNYNKSKILLQRIKHTITIMVISNNKLISFIKVKIELKCRYTEITAISNLKIKRLHVLVH